MAHPTSKLTSQGQVSVPAEIRRKLGIGPGAVLEWADEDDRIVVRPVGQYTSEDVHRALFAHVPRAKTADEMKAGVRRLMRKRHASR